jgi:hypothetical protein
MQATRLAALFGVASLVCAGLSACSDGDKALQQVMDKAADLSTCKAEATPMAAPYGARFPRPWSFPPKTTVYNYQDRGAVGVIVTGISSAPFKAVLAYLNHDAVDAGFKISEGETEAHDAEANWSGNGYTGRWAIRESATCPGETTIQVLADKAN